MNKPRTCLDRNCLGGINCKACIKRSTLVYDKHNLIERIEELGTSSELTKALNIIEDFLDRLIAAEEGNAELFSIISKSIPVSNIKHAIAELIKISPEDTVIDIDERSGIVYIRITKFSLRLISKKRKIVRALNCMKPNGIRYILIYDYTIL